MARFKPSGPFVVPMMLLIPTYDDTAAVMVKTYPAVADGIRINCTFRTFGGTDREVNGLYSVEDTATIETWFRPDIKSDCRIAAADNPTEIYEILGSPEDIERRHQYLRIRLQRVKGGA